MAPVEAGQATSVTAHSPSSRRGSRTSTRTGSRHTGSGSWSLSLRQRQPPRTISPTTTPMQPNAPPAAIPAPAASSPRSPRTSPYIPRPIRRSSSGRREDWEMAGPHHRSTSAGSVATVRRSPGRHRRRSGRRARPRRPCPRTNRSHRRGPSMGTRCCAAHCRGVGPGPTLSRPAAGRNRITRQHPCPRRAPSGNGGRSRAPRGRLSQPHNARARRRRQQGPGRSSRGHRSSAASRRVRRG